MDANSHDDHNGETQPLLGHLSAHHGSSSSSHNLEQALLSPPEYHVDMSGIDSKIKGVRHPTSGAATIAPAHHQCSCHQHCHCHHNHHNHRHYRHHSDNESDCSRDSRREGGGSICNLIAFVIGFFIMAYVFTVFVMILSIIFRF
ncbi:MAG: hypothetical protein JOS17DRAFT_815344 [Linnemannia elongata]|nr:MAG: hypothetical protein JOS17DRAFT_815344 [Linnemannia elongata]